MTVRCARSSRPDPAPHVQDPDPGRHRRPRHRARNPLCAAQGRHREMLRGRCDAQEKAAREAEGGQEEDAAVRESGNSTIGLHLRAENGQLERFIPENGGVAGLD
jgi:hypothetical protein